MLRRAMRGGAATMAVILLPLRNIRERVLRSYQFLNPIYRKKVKMWIYISCSLTGFRKKSVSFYLYLDAP